jgi:hypothetical protein
MIYQILSVLLLYNKKSTVSYVFGMANVSKREQLPDGWGKPTHRLIRLRTDCVFRRYRDLTLAAVDPLRRGFS